MGDVLVRFGGDPGERNADLEAYLRKTFESSKPGALEAEVNYAAGRGYGVLRAEMVFLRGKAYKPGEGFDTTRNVEDYRARVLEAIKRGGFPVAE